MNETNRQNGWRTFEKKAFAWLRKVWDVRPIEQGKLKSSPYRSIDKTSGLIITLSI
jgi:hypothetical protein